MFNDELVKTAEEYMTMGRIIAKGYISEMEKIAFTKRENRTLKEKSDRTFYDLKTGKLKHGPTAALNAGILGSVGAGVGALSGFKRGKGIKRGLIGAGVGAGIGGLLSLRGSLRAHQVVDEADRIRKTYNKKK